MTSKHDVNSALVERPAPHGGDAKAGANRRAIGGIARAERLSPAERSRIAKRAAAARWSDDLPQAVCGSPDRPLRIVNVELQCYVLDDGTRVLSQAGFLGALGRHPKANVRNEGVEGRMPAILQGKA